MENTIFRTRRSTTLRERVTARRERRSNSLFALFFPRPRRGERVQAAAYGQPAGRPVRTDRQLRVANHFSQIGQQSQQPQWSRQPESPWQRLLPRQPGQPAWHSPQQPSWRELLLDEETQDTLRAWLPRLLVALVACGLVAALFMHGSSTKKARAAALPVQAAATATPKPQPAGEKTTILLLGSDRRPEDASFRTDVIILLTVDPKQGTVSALSFPRDLVVKIPGYGDDRINVAMQYGGFELMQDALENSFGARPQYYFMTNFAGFTGLINSIGGIDVYAAADLTDACDLYWSRAGTCEIVKGKVNMDGDTALWYARSRHSTSDFDRTRRAQEVMVGIFNRMMSMDVLVRVPELYQQYSQDVETNMPLDKILSLLPVAADVAQHPSKVERFNIPEEVTADWIMFTGARVLLPNYDAIKEIVKEAGAAK